MRSSQGFAIFISSSGWRVGAQPHIRLERMVSDMVAGFGSWTPEVKLETFDLGIMD